MIRREFADRPDLRQFAYTNGIEIARAIGDNDALRFQLQALKNWEVRQAAINAGIDLGERHVGSRQGLGEAQVGRQDLFRQMLERGVKPEDIPRLAKPPEGSWQFTKPMKMYRAIRATLAVLHHELGHAIVAGGHEVPQLGIMSHHHPNISSGAAAAALMDQSAFLDEKGDWDPAKVAPRVEDILEFGAGGIAANELLDGIPRQRNSGGRGDLATMVEVMDVAKIPKAQQAGMINAAIDRAIEKLRPLADMIRDEASRREDNLRIDWHFSQRRVQNIVERAKREALEKAGQQPLWGNRPAAPQGGGPGAAQGLAGPVGAGPPVGAAPPAAPRLKRFVPPKVDFVVVVDPGSGIPRPPEVFTATGEAELQALISQKYPNARRAMVVSEHPLKPVGPVALPFEKGESPLKDMVADEDVAGRARREERNRLRPVPIGRPANATVIAPNLETGKPGYFGPLTPEQYKQKWGTQLTPQQIEQWRNWYPDVRSRFETWFGDNIKKLGAWVMSQKNTSPSTGMANVQRVEDQMGGQRAPAETAAGEPRKTIGGMAEDEIRAMLEGKTPTEGAAAKLHDFMDSILGRETRTWMGDDAKYGQPAPIDIHGGRGTGFVDQKMINAVKEQYGADVAKQLEADFKGSLSEAQYAHASKVYNDLAQQLNRENYMGGGWNAAAVQAVDWAATGMQLGRNMELPAAIFDKNIRRIAYEVNPNPNSPIGKIADWNVLAPEQARLVTHDVAEHAVNIANKEAGGMVAHRVYGMGGWMDTFNPSARVDMLSSPEAAERAGLILGHLLGQEEVLIVRPRMGAGNGHVFEITEVGTRKLAEPAVVEQYWQAFRNAYPEAEGFMPTRNADGTVGMSIAKKNGHFSPEDVRRLVDATDKANDAVGIEEAKTEESPAEVISLTNDWATYPNGEQYLQRLKGIGKSGILGRMKGYNEAIQRKYIDAFQRAITRTREGP